MRYPACWSAGYRTVGASACDGVDGPPIRTAEVTDAGSHRCARARLPASSERCAATEVSRPPLAWRKRAIGRHAADSHSEAEERQTKGVELEHHDIGGQAEGSGLTGPYLPHARCSCRSSLAGLRLPRSAVQPRGPEVRLYSLTISNLVARRDSSAGFPV